MSGLGEKTIFIRLSTSEVHGMGHISRMLAFRREVKFNVVWFVDPGTSNRLSGKLPVTDKIIHERCVKSILKLLSHYRQFRCDLVVCDSHQIKQDAFDCITCKVVFFNDRHVVATRNNFIYVNFQPKAKLGNKHFSGLKYLPIDTRGKLQKQINFDNVGRYINCLIGFGAVDSKDITCLVLNAIASSDSLRSVIRPICLVGENYRGLAELKKVLGKFEHSVILSGLNSTLDVPIACLLGLGRQVFRMYKDFF